MTRDLAQTIRLNPQDNVIIALMDLAAGAVVPGLEGPLQEAVARGHKIASHPIAEGEKVLRYGQTHRAWRPALLRQASMSMCTISAWAGHAEAQDFSTEVRPLPVPSEKRHFMGYHRADGSVGTRNYLGILTSVNCSGSVARFMAEAAEKQGWLDAFENVDGVVPIVHGTGCGMSGSDEGYDTLFRTLQGYARNPNFAGILLLGLGCEVMQVPDLVGRGRMRADGNIRYMTIQQSGGTRKTIERGIEHLKEMAAKANAISRAPAGLEHLMIGMQCGGSDGYSGITANPALGVASDLLVAHGGTTILSETSEIYGAEHLLTRRAVTPDVGEKIVERIRWWEDYTARNGGEMDNNPSPGNKKGGLTTILEKIAGRGGQGRPQRRSPRSTNSPNR